MCGSMTCCTGNSLSDRLVTAASVSWATGSSLYLFGKMRCTQSHSAWCSPLERCPAQNPVILEFRLAGMLFWYCLLLPFCCGTAPTLAFLPRRLLDISSCFVISATAAESARFIAVTTSSRAVPMEHNRQISSASSHDGGADEQCL